MTSLRTASKGKNFQELLPDKMEKQKHLTDFTKYKFPILTQLILS